MIKAQKLSRSFFLKNKSIEVLHEIDLEIEEGEFVAIVGRSGSGKSTLISLLSGLDTPSSGSIQIFGKHIESLTEEELTEFRRETLGFIFQSYNLIPSLTALENVVVPLQLSGGGRVFERGRRLLEQVGLGDRLDHHPNELSGGEQQRVSICRALVHEPRIVFADEPTGNLDTKNGQLVMDLLKKMRAGKTLVMVTHDLGLAATADRIIELSDGKIIQNDAHSISAS